MSSATSDPAVHGSYGKQDLAQNDGSHTTGVIKINPSPVDGSNQPIASNVGFVVAPTTNGGGDDRGNDHEGDTH